MAKQTDTQLAVIDNAAVITEEVRQQYLNEGFAAEDIDGLEAVAGVVRNSKRMMVVGMIEVGAELAAAKERIKRGSWQYFVAERCAIGIDTAQRFMAAADLAARYPALVALADRFTPTTFAKLGQSRNTNDATVDALIQFAEAEEAELSDDIVSDIIRNAAPEAEPKKPARAKPLGFTPADKGRGEKLVEQLTAFNNHWFAIAQRQGVDFSTTVKHPDFKAMMKRVVNGDGNTDLEVSLFRSFALAFFAQYCAENGPDVIEIDLTVPAASTEEPAVKRDAFDEDGTLST